MTVRGTDSTGSTPRSGHAYSGVAPAWSARSGELAEDGFKLGKELLDTFEIGTVCGKIDENCTASFDGFLHASNFVNGDVIHEHDITSSQGQSQNLFDISPESLAIHCPFEHERRSHAVMAQRSDEGGNFPVAVQHLLN